MTDGSTGLRVFFAIVFIVLLLIFGPMATIWAVSKLWDVNAVYDFWHWLAAAILSAGLFGGVASSKK